MANPTKVLLFATASRLSYEIFLTKVDFFVVPCTKDESFFAFGQTLIDELHSAHRNVGECLWRLPLSAIKYRLAVSR